jgi:peptide/nickel transport system permease protein
LGFKEYFFKRAVNSVIVWIFVLILNFFMFYTPSTETRFVPLPGEVVEYLNFVFVERFGPYFRGGEMPTLDYVVSFSGNSLILIALSLVIAITLGIFLGTLASYKASYKQGGKIDAALSAAALVPFTFPIWWVALVLRSYLTPKPFPAFFWVSDKWLFQSPWSDILGFTSDYLNHLFLPLATFVLTLTGVYFIVSRNSLRNVYAENYIVTAKAKGLSPLKVMLKHALRNAAIPVISIIALTPPILILGAIMNERVFSRGGLGYVLMKTAIGHVSGQRLPPTPVLQALFIVFATIVIVLHFIVDISVCLLDPRIRTDGAGLERFDRRVRDRKPAQSFPRKVLNLLKKFMRGYSGKFGLGVILFFAIAGLITPYLPIPAPTRYAGAASQPPSLDHLLGTNQYGFDVLSMVLWGARSSLVEGLGAVALALTIGYFVGLFSGYYSNRWIGYLLDRITDVFLSVPIIILIVYFPNITPFTATPLKWLLGVGLTTWPFTAKLVRAAVISAKDLPFVEAARAAGAGDAYILFRCLLPDCVPAAASIMPLLAVTALSTQSCLDYLGFERNLWSRIDPVLLAPYTSWGTILSYGTDAFSRRQWWIMFPPAICISLLGLALVAIGNKAMEVTNPRLAA